MEKFKEKMNRKVAAKIAATALYKYRLIAACQLVNRKGLK
jgi:hypothetical protein